MIIYLTWCAAALQSELAVVLLAAALVLPDLFTSLVVRQVQHLISTTQLLHLQGDRSQVRRSRQLLVCC